jgi:hypothetical protein
MHLPAHGARAFMHIIYKLKARDADQSPNLFIKTDELYHVVVPYHTMLLINLEQQSVI